MSMTWEFSEHEEFHRAALHMAVAGGLAGLAVHVAGLAVPAFGPMTGALALGAVATATSYGVLAPAERTRLAVLARLVLAGVGACAVLLVLGKLEPWLGSSIAAALLAAMWARGLTRQRFAIALVCASAALLVAGFVLQRFVTASLLASAPAWAVAWLAGTAFAGVATLGLVPRHVRITRDPVRAAWDACRGSLSGEVDSLLRRAMGVWTGIEKTLGPTDESRRAIENALLRLMQVTEQWQAIENGSRGDQASDQASMLATRIEEMDARIAATEDGEARAQYEHARAALSEQLRYLREIGTSRDRVLARLHHYVAAIERLRFAVVNSRSADASRRSSEAQPLIDELESLGRDLDLSSEAWSEAVAAAE